MYFVRIKNKIWKKENEKIENKNIYNRNGYKLLT